MKSLDLNSIKDREVIIMSSEEALKDVYPMYDFDLYQIKQLYCKYRCNLKNEKVFVCFKDEDTCPECHANVDTYFEGRVIIGEDACKICQWDNIINELKEFNLIKK